MINWYVQLREKVFILGWFTFLIGFLFLLTYTLTREMLLRDIGFGFSTSCI